MKLDMEKLIKAMGIMAALSSQPSPEECLRRALAAQGILDAGEGDE